MIDKQVADLIAAEEKRQREGLELIPSENYVSRDVVDAMGSGGTNKYSEGYPGRRYYGGQENTDKLETLAIERAKKLFKADHANVQPHSGAPANEAVYSAWLEPGDTVLAMDLSHGGHLTHGAPVTRSAKLYNFIRYKMKDPATGEIDYEALRALAQQHKPKIILAGFSAYPRELDYAKFAEIGNEVGALLMADMAHIAVLIAAGVRGVLIREGVLHSALGGDGIGVRAGGMVYTNQGPTGADGSFQYRRPRRLHLDRRDHQCHSTDWTQQCAVSSKSDGQHWPLFSGARKPTAK